MKVNELVETMKKNRTVSLSKLIETKAYLSFEEKVDLAHLVIDKCSKTKNNIVVINEIDQYIYFTIESIKAYTNIEFDEQFYIVDYDLLCSSGLLGNIIETFEGEYKMLLNLIEMEKKQVLYRNTIEYQVSGLIGKVSEAVEELSDALKNKVDSIDVENINISTDIVNQLGDFMQMLK